MSRTPAGSPTIRNAVLHALVTDLVAVEREERQVWQCPTANSSREGLHPLIADLVVKEVKYRQVWQRPAADDCSKCLHSLISNLVASETESHQVRQRPNGNCITQGSNASRRDPSSIEIQVFF